MLAGLAAFQAAPRPPLPPPPLVIASQGRARVFDYGGDGPVAVFVPSLINPASILDLAQDNSLLRWLATQGVRPMLVDWGVPDAADAATDLAGHVADVLHPMLRTIGVPYHLVGYCLGGTLAMAAAALDTPLSLTLIATPWRFSAFPDQARDTLQQLWESAQPTVDSLGVLPLEILQTAFWLLDPDRTVGKYARFADMEPGSDAANSFIRLEDWANSGAPLTRAAARELIDDFFTIDLPGAGRWEVSGRTIDPTALTCPVLQIVSTTDRIVPAATAADVGHRHDLALGHVGMVMGSRARAAVWQPLASWLSQTHPSW